MKEFSHGCKSHNWLNLHLNPRVWFQSTHAMTRALGMEVLTQGVSAERRMCQVF